jgi:hypothetical protein
MIVICYWLMTKYTITRMDSTSCQTSKKLIKRFFYTFLEECEFPEHLLSDSHTIPEGARTYVPVIFIFLERVRYRSNSTWELFHAIRHRNYGIRKNRDSGHHTTFTCINYIFSLPLDIFSFDLDKIWCS